MRAEILTIGDELCRGEIVDTNSSGLAARLWDLGITTRWMTSCCDVAEDITSAVRQAVARADVVVCSGGLGPTEDDLTVDVMAQLVGVAPVVDEASRARMAARFAQTPRLDPNAPLFVRQVRVPAGARVYVNPQGLAPAFEQPVIPSAPPFGGADGRAQVPTVIRTAPPFGGADGRAQVPTVEGVPVFCLPGVPRELWGIWDAGMGARFAELASASSERIARQIYRVFGRGESQISGMCRGLVDGVAGATIHYQVKFPETLVKLVVRDAAQPEADARLAALDAGLRERLGGFLYGTGEESLVERATRRLVASGKTCATAESCTGGMIGELITRTPGSSRVFVGGAIAYANAEKVRQLGVAPATLDAHGAVSEETAREMAAGARERFGTELAVAVTGIAGPDGGTPEKPVGTVWLALASPSGVVTKKLGWPGLRDQIRTLAAWWALKLIDDAV